MTATVESGAYVLAVVPAGTPVPPADPEGPITDVRLVAAGDVAAVVATPPLDRPLGKAADLVAHDRLISQLVESGAAVLPMRFGAVLTDDDAVAAELLADHQQELLDELSTVAGRSQYTVRVRHDRDVALREIVAGDPRVQRLLSSDDGPPRPGADFDRQLRLGELVVRTLEQTRPALAEELLSTIGEGLATRVREPASPDDILDVACLVPAAAAGAFERRVEDFAERHADRFHVRMVGPTAAYDFVGRR